MSLRATLTAISMATLAATVANAACVSNTNLVPGAECQVRHDLPDLATPTLIAFGRTDASDWATLHSQRTINPKFAGPGVQIDGYFPDNSTTNTTNGWSHDSQFVIRLPVKARWNGKLVITGAPGVRKQYAIDYLMSDWFVARGYAYASTDKGNTGTSFFVDGVNPGDAVAEWNYRVTQLTISAKATVKSFYGEGPSRTYMTGISNGGYLTRWQLENRPDLYDGGVDWEGTHWRPEGPNLFTYLPAALKYYPLWAATRNEDARQAMFNAGFAPGSEDIWPHHYAVYWDLTQRTYREEFDPDFDGATAGGYPFCPSQTIAGCDADYDYFQRLQRVSGLYSAVNKVSLTGKIERPMITLHGTLDALLPIAVQSQDYVQKLREVGREALHRYYIIDGGNHVDQLYDEFPDKLRPIVGCYRAAFLALERWVESRPRVKPVASQKIPRPSNTDLTIDMTNDCPQLGPEYDIPILSLP